MSRSLPPQPFTILILDLGALQVWQLWIELLVSSARLTGEGWSNRGCLSSTLGAAGGTLIWQVSRRLQSGASGVPGSTSLTQMKWLRTQGTRFILETTISCLSKEKYFGISSLRTVLNFQVSFYFQAIKLPPSHLHWWLFWSSPFSSAWYRNTISANELSSKHCIVAPLPTYSRRNKGVKMVWLLTQSPAFTYIFTLTISIHCKFPSHSVVSRTHYQFFTDLSFSGACHCMCCKIGICACTVARLSSCFYRINCDISSVSEIRWSPKSIKHFLLKKGYDAICSKIISILTVSQHGPQLQIFWIWDYNSFVCSKRNTHSFCIMPAIYTTKLLDNSATACSSPAVTEKEPSSQGSLSWTGHPGVLH